MGRSLSRPDVAKIEALLLEGHSQAAVARLTGFHPNTIYKFTSGVKRKVGNLRPEAQRATEDFGYFRARYFGRVTTPWQEKAALKIVELLNTPDDEYLVLNCPPGSGKSTLLTDTCTWVLCRDRTKRILYGSAAQSVAADYTSRIMNDLTRTMPTKASTRNLQLGLEQDGEAVLEKDFGVFKSASMRWTKEKFYVSQLDGSNVQEKEPNVVAFGRDSTFLGGRYDLCVWDDLVSEKTIGTDEVREKLVRWWNNIAETRVEPGGLNALVGQRLDPDDLYRYCIDLPSGAGYDDFNELEDHVGGDPDGDYPRKYHHVVFPAHFDDDCKGAHSLDSPAWPEGCLLDPKRLSWRKLSMIRANPLNSYETVYQQQDSNPEQALVHPLWVEGGRGKNGEMFTGCLDHDRDLWSLPGVGSTFNAITVDPSPSRYWSVQMWCHDPNTDLQYLLDLQRTKMDSPAWLDYNPSTQTYSGLAETWVQQAAEIGRPVRYVIVEQNAAQKFMLQSAAVKQWARSRNVLLVGHDTNSRNKTDKDFGVQALGPRWMHGKVRLPYASHFAKQASGHLIREVTRWPMGATDDCVMAHWFFNYQLPRLSRPTGKVYEFRRPSWVRTA